MSFNPCPQGGCGGIKIKWVTSDGITKQVRKLQWPCATGFGTLPQSFIRDVWDLFNKEFNLSTAKMQYMDDDRDWVRLDKAAELDVALLTQKLRPFLIVLFDECICLEEKALTKIFKDNNLKIPRPAIDKSTTTTVGNSSPVISTTNAESTKLSDETKVSDEDSSFEIIGK